MERINHAPQEDKSETRPYHEKVALFRRNNMIVVDSDFAISFDGVNQTSGKRRALIRIISKFPHEFYTENPQRGKIKSSKLSQSPSGNYFSTINEFRDKEILYLGSKYAIEYSRDDSVLDEERVLHLTSSQSMTLREVSYNKNRSFIF